MKGASWGLITGITIGVIIGLFLAVFALFCIRYRRRRAQISSSSSRRNSTIPIRVNGVDSSTILSDSTIGQDSPKHSDTNGMSFWFDPPKRKSLTSMSGIPKYSYRDLQKATLNFKTLIGHGAFGPVYKAEMPGGETVAVKVLAKNSKQGEKEFQTEVLLLGRLHHRNLVNLVGYCTERGQNMLVYVYMSNGSLGSHLYDLKHEPLKWDQRVLIAQDVARGLEYLHDGAVPPVLHRDIKSGNILLDKSMRARVADFGLSREEAVSQRANDIRGTYGYLDPEYISTRSYTKKSDVYSFGVLLFELITGKNPNQGLLELVDLAALDAEGKGGWEEIVDPRIDGNYDLEELNGMAMLAYKCMNRSPRRRPSMGDTVQALSRIYKLKHNRRHTPTMSLDSAVDMSQLESQSPNEGLHREESVQSKLKHSRRHTPTMSLDSAVDMSQLESQSPSGGLHREESVQSIADSTGV